MTTTELRGHALSLPLDERMKLTDELWASIRRDRADLPLWPWQERILDQRLAKLDENPHAGSSCEEVRAELWPERAAER
jgi:putative addiction module component (TIGR02574 family)